MFSINLHKNIFLFPLNNAGCLLCTLSKRLFSFFSISFQYCALLPFIFLNTLFSDLWMPSVSTNERGIVRRIENSLIEGRYFSAGSRQMMNLPHWTEIHAIGYHDHLLIYSSIIQHWAPGRDSNLILGHAYLGPKFT